MSDREWKLYPHEAALEAKRNAAPELYSALERLSHNFELLLAGKPVRDVSETKAEVNAALDKAKPRQ